VKPQKKVLIVEDAPTIRASLRSFLMENDFDVVEAESIAAAQKAYGASRPDLAIVDYVLPDGNGLELLPMMKDVVPSTPMIILTGHGSIDLAVQAVKQGVDNFLTKPVDLPSLKVIIQRALENQRNTKQALVRRASTARDPANPFVGTSVAIRMLEEHARKIASSESPVIILGETGSGKGVLAKWLHDQGPRADEAFVDLNCASLSVEFLESELFGHERGAFTGAVANKAGLFEVAHRGTVFLDEIGEMSMAVQPRLLKVLEDKRFRRLGDVADRQVDIRLIAATEKDLGRMVQDKNFRGDLYYRLSTIVLRVPSLRERLEDVPMLAQNFVKKLAIELGRPSLTLSESAEKALVSHSFPGNVRELRNLIERAALMANSDTLSSEDFHFNLSPRPAETPLNVPAPTDVTMEEAERLLIERVLREESGQVANASKRLGIPRSTLYQKIKRYGLPRSQF
jgi:DNA-binding NtrC family response regulator